MNESNVLQFEHVPVGNNGKINLTVKLDNNTLVIDKLDILSASVRDKFAKKLCKDRPGIDCELVNEQLLSIAGEVQKQQSMELADEESSGELDVSHIVRPERFITPQVSGLTVATLVLCGGKPASRWRVYLQWTSNTREVRDLSDSIDLPNKTKLWIHPIPGQVSIKTVPAWSESARKAWLAGEDSPDPAEIFKKLCKCIAYFVDFPEQHGPGATSTLALWVMLTYVYPAWSAVPYLYLGGPAGSGKTRVFEVLSRLVFRPLQSSNMTGAALFRTLHGNGGTLIYDEAERLKQNTPDVGEINSMLLAGYKRGGRATRLEPVGDTFKTVEFDVFGPKALACIKGLPVALGSRCISIYMFRAGKDSLIPRRRIDNHSSRWQTLRDDLHALALNYGPDFLSLAGQHDVCPNMSGRNFELWQPLLALAGWIEECGAVGLLKLMQDHAIGHIESGQDEQTPDCDEALLRSLAKLLESGSSPIAKDVLEEAKTEESRMFDSWSAKGAANALKRYSIKTKKTVGRRTYRHVTLDDLKHVQAVYGMDLGLTETNDENNGQIPPE
ncbi:hypothetical protein ES705_20122 [subsurface metagenome]